MKTNTCDEQPIDKRETAIVSNGKQIEDRTGDLHRKLRQAVATFVSAKGSNETSKRMKQADKATKTQDKREKIAWKSCLDRAYGS